MYQFWLFLGLLILTGVAGQVLVSRRRELRALRALAGEYRLSFSPEDLIDLHERYQNLDFIRQGHSRHVCNMLYGPTQAGLVTIFSYSCELGFGVGRSTRRWWVTVVETSGAHRHWRAAPADAAELEGAATVGRFHVRADHEETLHQLREAGLERVFEFAPPDCRWEVRGPLVAVARPFDADPQTLRRLFDSACELAEKLKPNAHVGQAVS